MKNKRETNSQEPKKATDLERTASERCQQNSCHRRADGQMTTDLAEQEKTKVQSINADKKFTHLSIEVLKISGFGDMSYFGLQNPCGW